MPVTQFNMKWVEPAGLVKFDFLGLTTLTVLELAVKLVKRRGIDIDLVRPAARRCQILRDAGPRRHGRRVPGGKRGHAPRAHRHAARPLRGHHRAGRALPAGTDGQYPDLLRAQARQRAAGLHPSEARADPARDLRRHRLSGTGDAGRRRCSSGYSLGEADLLRRAMGKKIRKRNAGAARPLRLRRGRRRRRPRRRRRRSSNCSSGSPTTASTRATPPLTRWSRIKPRT